MTNPYDTYGLSAEQMMIVNSEVEGKKKDKMIVILLWLFLATVGAQRFYLGNTGYAIALILLGWATLFIWPLLDIIFALKELDRQNEKVRRDAIDRVRLMNIKQPNPERAAVRVEEEKT